MYSDPPLDEGLTLTLSIALTEFNHEANWNQIASAEAALRCKRKIEIAIINGNVTYLVFLLAL